MLRTSFLPPTFVFLCRLLNQNTQIKILNALHRYRMTDIVWAGWVQTSVVLQCHYGNKKHYIICLLDIYFPSYY